MPQVDLTETEWGQVMAMISQAPWRDANPLLMKIGEQLRQQTLTHPGPPPGVKVDANGKEVGRE